MSRYLLKIDGYENDGASELTDAEIEEMIEADRLALAEEWSSMSEDERAEANALDAEDWDEVCAEIDRLDAV